MNPIRDSITREHVRISELEMIFSKFGTNPKLFSWVLSVLEILEPEQVWRGVGLLRILARTRSLSEQELAALAEKAELAEHWVARLNLCQLLSITGVPASVRDDFFPFLRESFADRRQIVRAWAISALLTFGQDARFRSEIAEMLRKARRESGKAMQARLRQLKVIRRAETRKVPGSSATKH